LDEIRLLLEDEMLDILALNETRLDEFISNELIDINNYVLIRKDRNRFGGGICLYIHSRNKYLIKENILCETNHEIIVIDIVKPNCKPFGICVFYRPPSSDRSFFESFKRIVQIYDDEARELLLMGDINCNFLSNHHDSKLQLIQSICDTYQISQLINEHTRITQTTSTLIDVIFTNAPSRIVTSGVCHLGISDHSLVYAIRKFVVPSNNKHKYVTYRCFNNFDSQHFREALGHVNWSDIDNVHDPSEMLAIWEKRFLEIANEQAPIKTRRVRNNQSPWLTCDIRALINHRNYLKKQATKTDDSQVWDDYKKFRNLVNNEIKQSKNSYYHSHIENNRGNPKALWRTINQVSGRNKTKSNSINEIKFNNTTATEPAEIAEILNDYFTNIGKALSSELQDSSTDFRAFLRPVESNFVFQPISVDFVIKFFNKMPVDKATGVDNISCRLLKEAAPVVAASLANIVNKSLSLGIFPSGWKTAKVIPLYKANDRDDPGNYRPISILPILSKLCERAVFNQIYQYFAAHDLFTKYQSGFRPLHSTLTALLDATNDWYANMDKGLTNLVVALDLAKAFDTVSHQILISKLENYGINGISLEFFKSYLLSRKQCCVVENSFSEPKSIPCGVPQGSILGPLLFIIYINDIPCCLDHSKPSLYADDTLITLAAKSATELQSKINSDLRRVSVWLLANKLSLNVIKSEYMLIGSKFKVPTFCSFAPIEINGSGVKKVTHLKHLGVYIDQNLNWDLNIDHICKKVCKSIYGLKQIRDFVPISTLITMYKSLIQRTRVKQSVFKSSKTELLA